MSDNNSPHNPSTPENAALAKAAAEAMLSQQAKDAGEDLWQAGNAHARSHGRVEANWTGEPAPGNNENGPNGPTSPGMGAKRVVRWPGGRISQE